MSAIGPVLIQMTAVSIVTPDFFSVHFNIILPYIPVSPKCSFLFSVFVLCFIGMPDISHTIIITVTD
jgi:hypothetical protein